MKATLKKIIYGTPVLGPLTRHVWGRWQALRLPFRTSGDYWEQRYRQAGNSGAGSYGRLAEFKAEVLNEFVARHSIGSVVEFGSGDGNQLTLAKYDNATYLAWMSLRPPSTCVRSGSRATRSNRSACTTPRRLPPNPRASEPTCRCRWM